MPKMSDAFPSKYLKADDDVPDINDGGLVVTITGAEFERIGQGAEASDKIVLSFKEVSKGLVLNKTNAGTITKLFGSDDTDDWLDRQIRLVATDVEFKGEMTRGIRVSTRPVKSATQARRDFDELESSGVGSGAGSPPNPAAIAKAEGDSGVPF